MTVAREYAEITRSIGARDSRQVVATLAGLASSPESIAATLAAHHLTSLTLAAVSETNLADALADGLVAAIEARRPPAGDPPAVLLAAFDEIRSAFEAERIPALQLKGLLFAARLYGDVHRRPQYDIDILVRRRHLRRAARVLERAGFEQVAYDLHSRTLMRGTIKVDLHRSLRWAPAYRLDEETIWHDSRVVELDGHAVPTTSDEYTLLLLVLAIFEDVGQGMGKLKQLLDLSLLAADVDATIDWTSFLARRADERVLAVTANVLALAIDALDASDRLPRLREALAPYRERVTHRSRDEALDLVLAPRKSQANLRWFRRVYPGSFPLYLACFWAAGFPENLRDPRRGSLRESIAVATGRPGTPSG